MNKKSLILKYFQKADLLTTRKSDYCRSITSLFKWMVENDKANSDLISKLLNIQSHHHARIISRQEAILAGSEEISFLLKNHTQLSFTPFVKDGKSIKIGQTVAEIEGVSSEILGLERIVLNILQRMSGIATETNNLTRQDPPFLAATRKTPWMVLDKKAVAVGGGLTHRLSLADGIIVKDNHLTFLRKKFGLKDDVLATKKALQFILPKAQNQLVEVEVKTEKEALETVKTFNKLNKNNYLAIMFDNFSPASFQSVLSKLGNLYDLSSVILEASGGINNKNIGEWSKTGADILSIGALTHSPHAVNLSLEF